MTMVQAQAKLIMKRLFHRFNVPEYVVVVVIAFVLTAVVLCRANIISYEHPDFPKAWDHHKYIRMTEGGPFDFHIAPFCWRIATPLFARMLPFSTETNFLVISFISVWMTGVLIYALARKFSFSRFYAFIAVLMYYSLRWAARFDLQDFWLPDALASCLILLSMYSIVAQKELLLMLTLFFGVAVKESVLFVAPLYYTMNATKPFDFKLVRNALFLIAPSIVLLVAIRLLVPQMNNDEHYLSSIPQNLRSGWGVSGEYNYWSLMRNVVQLRTKTFFYDLPRGYSLGTFGVMLTVLPFLELKNNAKFFLRVLLFLIC